MCTVCCFKQKTAYELRISDWSSDVCSSDLYYAGAQWIDDAPYMVQPLMIESFENSQRIVGVGRQSVSLRSDFVLRVEVREFQAQYDEKRDAPTINGRIGGKLVGLPERRILEARTVERLENSHDNGLSRSEEKTSEKQVPMRIQ